MLMDSTVVDTRPNTTFQKELGRLIVEVLNLEISPDDIDPDAALFGGEGLGLDSIDILEVALAIAQRYGFQLRSDDPDNGRIFASLRSLAVHVGRNRTK